MGICLDRSFIVGTEFQVVIVFVLFGICTCQNPPANFVFGDSLVDVGNNNYIASLSKANFFPHGIDFGRPTGRFTNGRTIVDILGKIFHSFFLSFFPIFFFGFHLIFFFFSILSLIIVSCFTRAGIGIWFHSTLLGSNHNWNGGSSGCQLCI